MYCWALELVLELECPRQAIVEHALGAGRRASRGRACAKSTATIWHRTAALYWTGCARGRRQGDGAVSAAAVASESLTAWYGVSAASVSGAALTGSSPGAGTKIARRRDDHVLRESAVSPEARAVRSEGRAPARVVAPVPALPALAAPPPAVDDDRIAFATPRRIGTERGDPSGDLVTERERKRVRIRRGCTAHEVEVRTAQPCRSHLDEHLRTARLGHRHFGEDGIRSATASAGSLASSWHSCSSSRDRLSKETELNSVRTVHYRR